jgi:hypothetical protein
MSKKGLETLYCDKKNGRAHTLARVDFAEGELTVIVPEKVGQYTHGIDPHRETFTRHDVARAASFQIDATCPCGVVFRIDVAAPFHGRPLGRPERLEPLEDGLGISSKRIKKYRRRNQSRTGGNPA